MFGRTTAAVSAIVLTLAFAFAVTSAGAVTASPDSNTTYPGQMDPGQGQHCAPVVAMPDECQPPENEPCQDESDPVVEKSSDHSCQPPEPCQNENEGDPVRSSSNHAPCPPPACPPADPGHMYPGDPVQAPAPDNCPPPPPVCPGDPACPPVPPVCPGDPACPPVPPVCPGDPACPPVPPVCPGDPACPPVPPVCPGDPSCPPQPTPGPTDNGPIDRGIPNPVSAPAALAVEPAVTEPASSPVAASAVAGASTGRATIAVSGAGARGPGGCIQRSFQVSVRGANILRVDFTLDGRTLARVTKRDASGLYRTSVSLAGVTRSSHRIRARVAFRPNVTPRVKTLPISFRRCAQVAAAPAFAG